MHISVTPEERGLHIVVIAAILFLACSIGSCGVPSRRIPGPELHQHTDLTYVYLVKRDSTRIQFDDYRGMIENDTVMTGTDEDGKPIRVNASTIAFARSAPATQNAWLILFGIIGVIVGALLLLYPTSKPSQPQG